MKEEKNTYQIGKHLHQEISPIIYSNYKKRYKGKSNHVTAKLKEYSDNSKPKDRTPQDIVKTYYPKLEVIENIRKKVTKDLEQGKQSIIKDLYSLIDKDILILAHAKLKSNDGATTAGPEGVSVDGFSMKMIEKIIRKLKNNTFRWKGTKYIELPRPGKTPRPLGIPDYDDKLVQCGILLILESIYDHLFKSQATNNGFISHRGCHDNIRSIIQFKNQGLRIALEGDIKNAFGNVKHNILMKILNKTIKDKKFLKLIYLACKAGKVEFKKGKTIHTKTTPMGTPQGSIMSPYLFNIYMNEFDQFILQEISKLIEEENKTRNHKKYQTTSEPYKNYTQIINAGRKSLKKHKLINIYSKLDKKQKDLVKYWNKRIVTMKKRRMQTRSLDPTKTIIRMFYTRYADDFLILLNSTIEYAQKIKNLIAEYLEKTLQLTLSEEKTLITDMKIKPVYFLGFRLYMAKRCPTTSEIGRVQRFGSELIQVGIDRIRRYKDLITKKYANKKHEPRETPYLTSFEPQEIIELYNSTINGLVNYYYGLLSRKSELNRIIYILHYSCLKTLAAKFRISIRRIFIKFGWPEYNTKRRKTNRIRLTWRYQVNDIDKYVILTNYTDAMDQGKWVALAMEKHKLNDELLTNNDYWNFYKLNWRTKFKYDTLCQICGSRENLESHHVRKIKGLKNQNEMPVLQKLNRKQLIICRKCHNKIHSGKYNGISLKELADMRATKGENLLLSKTSLTDTVTMAQKGFITIKDKRLIETLSYYGITEENIKTYRSKPIIIDLKEGKIINHKEKAQKPQKETQKSTVKKLEILTKY